MLQRRLARRAARKKAKKLIKYQDDEVGDKLNSEENDDYGQKGKYSQPDKFVTTQEDAEDEDSKTVLTVLVKQEHDSTLKQEGGEDEDSKTV